MPDEIKVRTELNEIFLDEAERRLHSSQKAFKAICENVKNKNPVHQELWNEEMDSLHSIILSVFTLESYINMVGHDGLSKEKWELLKLDKLERKWYIFPLILTGKTFDINSQLFKDFRHIIDLRNYLVHYKDYDYNEFVDHPSNIKVAGIYDHVNAKNAELAFTTAEKMIEQLKKGIR